MGFGDFETICSKAAIPLCALVGPPSPISGSTGIIPNCYARNIELANTIIFEGAASFLHIVALMMTVIMVLHVRSKFTAVGMPPFNWFSGQSSIESVLTICITGRKEITTFFYIYMALTICSLVIDAGVVPPRSPPFPYFVAVQNGLTSALCTCLVVNGFVGFQLYEDGTALSVWLLRLTSMTMFAISFLVSLLTFKSWGGLSPTNTIGLFVVLYVLNAICIAIYLAMQLLLVMNTLEDRWPLCSLIVGVLIFIVGQVLLYGFSDIICDNVQHYLDGLFFATMCNLFSVMTVYKVCSLFSSLDVHSSFAVLGFHYERGS